MAFKSNRRMSPGENIFQGSTESHRNYERCVRLYHERHQVKELQHLEDDNTNAKIGSPIRTPDFVSTGEHMVEVKGDHRAKVGSADTKCDLLSCLASTMKELKGAEEAFEKATHERDELRTILKAFQTDPEAVEKALEAFLEIERGEQVTVPDFDFFQLILVRIAQRKPQNEGSLDPQVPFRRAQRHKQGLRRNMNHPHLKWRSAWAASPHRSTRLDRTLSSRNALDVNKKYASLQESTSRAPGSSGSIAFDGEDT